MARAPRGRLTRCLACAAASNLPSFTGPRLIVFILGGVTHSEVRHVYRVSARLKRQVVVGSTTINSPTATLDALTELATGGGAGASGGGFGLL